MNILFYSDNDRSGLCRELIMLMRNLNLLQNFKLICVDGRIESMPKYLTAVPTLMVASTNKLWVRREALDYINAIRYMSQTKVMQPNTINQNQQNGPNFHSSEMNGFSDDYAYTKHDFAQSKTFIKPGDEKNHAIYTAPKTGKINASQQTMLINERKMQREKQNEKFKQLAKKNQLNQVVMAKCIEQMQKK